MPVLVSMPANQVTPNPLSAMDLFRYQTAAPIILPIFAPVLTVEQMRNRLRGAISMGQYWGPLV